MIIVKKKEMSGYFFTSGHNMKIFYILLLILLIFTFSGELYKVNVDSEFGFFSVRSNESNYTTYLNETIYINVGDTIIWENAVASDTRIAIISDDHLWDENKSVLAWNTKTFSYTFNKTGTFRFHIKESTFYDFNKTDPGNVTIDEKYYRKRYQRIVVKGNVSSTSTNRNLYIFNIRPSRINNSIINHFTRVLTNSTGNNSEKNKILISRSVSEYKKFTIIEIIKSFFTN